MNSSDTLMCWDWETGINTYNITSDSWNCAEHYAPCECPRLRADPDIAGIGVTASLLTSAVITALASLVCVLSSSVHPREWIVNRIDARARPWLGDLVGKILDEQKGIRVAKVSHDLAVCLGDQQLVTAIALLIAALKKLQVDGTLSTYHFTFVVNIATLSSAANTYASMTYWNMKYMDEPKHDVVYGVQNPQPLMTWKRLRSGLPFALRVGLMYTLDGLLLYSGWASFREDWGASDGCPALCVMKNSPLGWKGRQDMIFNVIFVISSDIAVLVQIISSFRVWCWWVLHMRPKVIDDRGLPVSLRSKERTEQPALLTRIWRRCRMKVQSFSEEVVENPHQMSRKDRIQSILFGPSIDGCRQQNSTNQHTSDGRPFSTTVGLTRQWIIRPSIAVLSRLWLIRNSSFFSLLELTAWFCVFFSWTIQCRVVGENQMTRDEREAEQAMGFGQIVPVFLLVLFVLQMADSFNEHCKDTQNITGAMAAQQDGAIAPEAKIAAMVVTQDLRENHN
ncbi:hypothetical protein B0T20DRAFT_275183 [Sordaria brevicollis]|uniref:Uncharacterized protein n=1 Tax=Sordaria brevicollis TaxID=83679 RepID=A0AAE0PB38_SORBR|nr:hypothetical protein B0T20DRAFT_275183 [Sordaria brevicollis]